MSYQIRLIIQPKNLQKIVEYRFRLAESKNERIGDTESRFSKYSVQTWIFLNIPKGATPILFRRFWKNGKNFGNSEKTSANQNQHKNLSKMSYSYKN